MREMYIHNPSVHGLDPSLYELHHCLWTKAFVSCIILTLAGPVLFHESVFTFGEYIYGGWQCSNGKDQN